MTNTITRTDLQALMAAGAVTLVDALPAAYYDQEHLPGAINLVEAAGLPTHADDTPADLRTRA